MASILPDILPTNISISNSNDITALATLSNENSIQQLKSQIKSQLIYSMNVYCGYYYDNSNTTVCTVLGTKYTAQFIAENLSINLPTLSNLKVHYSPNQTTIPNVTLSFDNCLIKENFTISNFISPLEAFDSYKLEDILSTVSLNNLNTSFPQMSYTTLSQDIENNIMEQLNKNSNKLVINGFNLTADEIIGSLNISIPKTISYLNGSLQNLYINISTNNNSKQHLLKLEVTGFKTFTFTKRFLETVSKQIQNNINSYTGNSIYLSNYAYNVKESLNSSYYSYFSNAIINSLESYTYGDSVIVDNISFNVWNIIHNAQCKIPNNLTQSQITLDEDNDSISGVVLQCNNPDINVPLPTIYLNNNGTSSSLQ